MSLPCATGFELVQRRRRRPVRVQHGQLRVPVRVPDGDAGREAVPLRFRQRVGSLHLDRVLRRDHHERQLQRIGGAVHRDLAFLHAFQQRRLRLGRRPVDLVAEDDVGEDRPGLELELAQFLVEGADPGQVARQQVRRELNPPDRAVDGPGQRLGQLGLADAGHVLDEHVPLGEQDGHRQPDRLGLAGDHRLHGRADAMGHRHEFVQLPVGVVPRVNDHMSSSRHRRRDPQAPCVPGPCVQAPCVQAPCVHTTFAQAPCVQTVRRAEERMRRRFGSSEVTPWAASCLAPCMQVTPASP